MKEADPAAVARPQQAAVLAVAARTRSAAAVAIGHRTQLEVLVAAAAHNRQCSSSSGKARRSRLGRTVEVRDLQRNQSSSIHVERRVRATAVPIGASARAQEALPAHLVWMRVQRHPPYRLTAAIVAVMVVEVAGSSQLAALASGSSLQQQAALAVVLQHPPLRRPCWVQAAVVEGKPLCLRSPRQQWHG